ncbi:organic cation/carnitine transporter 3-like [Pyrus ussuriensis x Pyrus communis]|uniref:Organic cation/carnitine transporter 3-like n=1 Tax=Pyrus ussuriensis x Pyrus communis TaxID=2448454 RepID=A0A5N5ICU8_9ROSA|nr:organic cation/carnitine transporter 3-like [Pyrus ussuriensis x Pyrus communis]
MADPTPFGLDPNMEDPETLRTNLLNSLDQIIEQNQSSFGWKQFLQAILVSLASLFDGQQTFISVYTDAIPTWHCSTTTTTSCTTNSNICDLADSDWSWDSTSSTTIISDWSLQCSSSFIRGLPASSYFLGGVVGGFLLGTLADSSLGRKKLLLISCVTMSLASFITIFSPNVWVYSAVRFISGVGRSSISTCVLVLLMEKVGKKWRPRVGIMQFFFFTLGFLSLPLIAYLNRANSWRALYLCTSIPAVLYCLLLQFFVSESPRWLFMNGKKEEAVAILLKSAGQNYPSELKLLLVSSHEVEVDSSNISNHPYKSMKDLFAKRWAMKRTLTVMVLGFGIGMVYYGMPLGVGSLGFNIYLSVMFNALLEIPSYPITCIILERWSRKFSVLGFCLVSGICGIVCAVVGQKGVRIGLELASFFCSRTAWNLISMFTVELFPTCVRNSATSLLRQSYVLSAVFSSMLVSVGSSNEFLSYGVFGLAIFFSGFFVGFLPDTRGGMLCDTMDEQERKENMILR